MGIVTVPLMHVTHCGVGCFEPVAPWRARMIRYMRALRGNDVR